MNDVHSIAPFDFHLHTALSADGEGTIFDFCEEAQKRGMKTVGFCEHVDLDPNDPYCRNLDYEKYQSQIGEARRRFDSIEILMGAEVGFLPKIADDIAAYLDERHFDYVIGSVHAVYDGEAGVSDEYEALETFAKHDPLDIFAAYFDAVEMMVRTGLFDVVGHLDLVRRYGQRYLKEPLEWGIYYGPLRGIFEGAIKRSMPIEINTSGLRQAPESTYPDEYALKLFRELTGSLVLIGSDAHRVEDLGAGVPIALKIAKDLDLNPYISFKDRLPEQR